MSKTSQAPGAASPQAGVRPEPWWRFGIVWFAFSGPAIVVVAGFATMAIAYRHADAVLTDAALAPAPHVLAAQASTTSPAAPQAPAAHRP